MRYLVSNVNWTSHCGAYIEAEIEFMGKTVGWMCILVLTDNHSDTKRMNGLPGIVGKNVIEELEAC